MAALVLLAIFAFVVAPAIDVAKSAFRGGGPDDAVVVRWDGGRMTRNEVELAMQKRNQVLNFLRALAKKVIEYGGEPAVPGFSRMPSGEIMSLGIDETLSPDRVLMNRIMATQAYRMGIQFDDKAADEFLLGFCDQKIADREFYEILKSNTSGLTIFDVREQIKQELAFTVARSLSSGTSFARSPATTWRDFLKLSQTAKVEAYPVLVNEFVGKVTGLPDESQIQEIFDQGKNRLPNQFSETPGFVRPARAKAEYVESKFQDWIDKEKANITEEEIQAEYDRLVELGLLRVPVTEESETQPSDSGGEDANSSESTSQGQETTDPETTDPETTDPETTDPETTDPETTDPETTDPETTGSEPPDSDAVLPDADRSDSSTIEGNSSDEDAQSSLISKSRVRLVAWTQDEEASDSEVTTEPLAQEASPVQDSEELTLEVASEPQTEEEPNKQPETENNPPTEASPDTATEVDEEIATSEPTEPSQSEPEMRTKTLEEARQEIVDDLARIKARPRAIEVLTRVQQMMREYYLGYRQYQAYKTAGVDDAQAPIRPDLKKYAQEQGLGYGETELGDSEQLAATSLGASSVFMDGRQAGFAYQLLPLPQVEAFSPMMSGLGGADPSDFSEFYFWKVDSRPATEPQLSEVREEVIAAWKQQQARSLAEESARELSKKVGGGDDPWESALSDTLRPLVITTDPFPWLARMGMGRGQIAITNVPKLEGVGEDFMRQVFSTQVGSVGVAPNEAKSVYYVFRVIEKLPSVEELQQRFEADRIRQGPMAVAQMELAADENNWMERVFADLNVKFEN